MRQPAEGGSAFGESLEATHVKIEELRSNMSQKLDSTQLLETVRERFSDPLKWEPGGWGTGDRRCVVGTIREMTGDWQIKGSSSGITNLVSPQSAARREPWFTAYEEVIFACASIIDPDWDAVKSYQSVRRTSGKGWEGEHKAVLIVLSTAEEMLMSYNDRQCRSADEMLALMEEATAIVRQQREAREAEWTQGSDENIVKKTLDAIPGLKQQDIVVASSAESREAEAEYEEMRKKNPDLPPIWPTLFDQSSTKKRKKARKRVRARGQKSAEKGVVEGGERMARPDLVAKGYAIR